MAKDKDVLSVRESFVPPRSGHVRSRRVFKARTKQSMKKETNLMGLFCSWLVEHQIGISLNLLSLLALVHLIFPRARSRTRKFVKMSYYDVDSGLYARGWDDAYLVFFYIVVFTGLRAAVMDYVLKPFARRAGISSNKGRTRFAEQGWMLLYYAFFSSVGLHIFYNSPYWMNLLELWTNFPTKFLEPMTKWYYLVQFAFWLQQLYVVNIEERRKDHWQMFTHHVFTSALLFTSYGFYQTKVGNVILCLMDPGDILLPLAKVLNYLNYQTACDITFGIFIVTWFLTRHLGYLIVCKSIFFDMQLGMEYGCYDSTTGKLVSQGGGISVFANVLQPFNDPDGLVCFNPVIKWGFLGLLIGLQIITIIWFVMICRVAYKVLTGNSAQDSRSDDEDEDEEEEAEEYFDDTEDEKVGLDLESSVKVADVSKILVESDSKSTTGPAVMTKERSSSPVAAAGASRPRRSGRTSAISLPGHGDRKDLLGRIGCDKPT